MTTKKKRTRKYNEEHFRFLRENVINSQKDLTRMFNEQFGFNVTEKAINSLKKKLGIKSGLKGGVCKFTKEQVQFVKDNVVNPEKVLAKMVNDKFNTSYSHIAISNLKSRLHIKSGLVGGQFQKGQTSFNKGKKWSEFMSIKGQAASIKTCFKKGNTPHNHRPVGSERITRDGYVEVKVKEPNKWRQKHVLVWEENKGPVPKGYQLTFLDGNKQNNTIENLRLITAAQRLIMNRRGLYSDKKEITESGLALAALLNGINEKEKK